MCKQLPTSNRPHRINLTATLLLLLTAFLGLLSRSASADQTVTVYTSNWSPDPAWAGDIITSNAYATDSNPPQPQQEHSITPHWTWTTGTVYRSDSGTSGTFTPYSGDYEIAWNNSGDDTQSAVTFNGSFSDPGYYIVSVTVSVRYHDDTSNTDVVTNTGTGYLGGSASDLSGGSPQPNAMEKANAIPNPDATGGTGIPVKPNGNMIIVLDKTTLGLGKTITGNATATDPNGGILSNDTVVVSNSEDLTTTQQGQGQVAFDFIGDKVGNIWTEPHFPYQWQESTFAGTG